MEAMHTLGILEAREVEKKRMLADPLVINVGESFLWAKNWLRQIMI